MAWVSPKVYAILMNSEEGKDIAERLGDMSQDECQKELDSFFGEGGKGFESSNDYNQAKIDDEAEEERYKAIGDEEVSEKDYEEDETTEELFSKVPASSRKNAQVKADFINDYRERNNSTMKEAVDAYDKWAKEEVNDEEISEALADYQWHKDLSDKSEYAQIYKEDAMKVEPERAKKVVNAIENYIKESERGVITFAQMDKYAKELGLDKLSDEELSQMWEDVHNVAGYYGFGQSDFQKSVKILDAQSAFAEVINREARTRRGKK